MIGNMSEDVEVNRTSRLKCNVVCVKGVKESNQSLSKQMNVRLNKKERM